MSYSPTHADYHTALSCVAFFFITSDEYQSHRQDASLFVETMKIYANNYHNYAQKFAKENSELPAKTIRELCLFNYLVARTEKPTHHELINTFFYNFVVYEKEETPENTPHIYKAVRSLFDAASGSVFN
jgi:hypothetical protein